MRKEKMALEGERRRRREEKEEAEERGARV